MKLELSRGSRSANKNLSLNLRPGIIAASTIGIPGNAGNPTGIRVNRSLPIASHAYLVPELSTHRPVRCNAAVCHVCCACKFETFNRMKFCMPLYWVLLSSHSLLPTTNIIASIKFPCSSRDFHCLYRARYPQYCEQLQGRRAKYGLKSPEKCESFEMRGKPGMKQEGNSDVF